MAGSSRKEHSSIEGQSSFLEILVGLMAAKNTCLSFASPNLVNRSYILLRRQRTFLCRIRRECLFAEG